MQLLQPSAAETLSEFSQHYLGQWNGQARPPRKEFRKELLQGTCKFRKELTIAGIVIRTPLAFTCIFTIGYYPKQLRSIYL